VYYDYDNNPRRINFPDAELVCLIGNNSAIKFLTLSSVKPFERHAARLKPAAALMLRKCLTIGLGDRSLQWHYREIPRADASPVIRVTVRLRTILCHCCGARLKPANNFDVTSVIALQRRMQSRRIASKSDELFDFCNDRERAI